MKYSCKVCNGIMCFDGTTEDTIQYDVACHEMGDSHKRNLENILKTKE